MALVSTDPPVPLVGAALGRWAELRAAAKWSPAELDDLAAYCAAYGRWHDAETWLADPSHGSVVTIRDDKGNIKSHAPAPQVAVAERASKEMARLGKALRLRQRVRQTS